MVDKTRQEMMVNDEVIFKPVPVRMPKDGDTGVVTWYAWEREHWTPRRDPGWHADVWPRTHPWGGGTALDLEWNMSQQYWQTVSEGIEVHDAVLADFKSWFEGRLWGSFEYLFDHHSRIDGGEMNGDICRTGYSVVKRDVLIRYRIESDVFESGVLVRVADLNIDTSKGDCCEAI